MEKISVYEKLKQTPPEQLTSEELSEAIKEDIRCILLVPKGMHVEGMPNLSKQEIKDIRLVADNDDMEFSCPVPPKRRTEAVLKAAVLADPYFLKNAPSQQEERKQTKWKVFKM